MILKKLIEILKTFDKAELKRFERFVRSDYFNTNERVSKLLKSLKKFYPLFNNPGLTNEYLFRQIYGTRKFNDKTFRYLLSELLVLAGRYISIAVIEIDKTEMKKNLVDGMISRKLFSQTRSHLAELEKDVDRNFVIGTTYLHDKIDICLFWHMFFYFSGSQNPVMHKNIEGGEYLIYNTIIDLCHIYQSLNVIKSSHNIVYEDNLLFAFIRNFNFKGLLEELENIEKIYSVKNDLRGAQRRSNPIDRSNKDKTRLLNAFKIYLCFMITYLDEKDEEYFQKMKDLVHKNEDFFKREELRDIHVMLSNCCSIKRKTIDNKKYLRYLFEITKNALSKNLYPTSKGQYMAFTVYFRALDTALTLKELEWAENFVNKYIKEIAPEIRDDVYNYSIAELRFQRKQFEPVLESLAKVVYKYALIKPRVRSLMLMTYYELNHIEEAYSLIDSHSHFLNSNKKITPEQRKAELNFLSFIKEIFKIREKPENKETLDTLKNNITECNLLSRKEWLLEKVNELVQ